MNHDEKKVPARGDESRAELRETDHLQLLLDALADYAICMLDASGFVSSWNSGAQKLTWFSAEEMRGQHFSRFFTLEDQAKGLPADILQTASASGRYEDEGWLVRKGGSRLWVNTLVRPIRDADGNLIGFANISRDMTERMEAQAALRDTERRFRMLVEGVLDYAICMLDPTGIVTDWNSGGARMQGYTTEEIVGQHFSRFYTHEDRAAGLPLRVLEAAAREGRFEMEGWRLRKDGSRFWAAVVIDAVRNDKGELIGFAKITRDITERQRAQQALRESERQFRLLVNAVTDYALYMLDPNGIVVSWNSGAERIKGYTADEIIGQHFSRFYTEQDRSAGLPARSLLRAMEHGRFEAEGRRVRKNGELFLADVIIDPIRDENGQLVGFAKITRDITERKRVEAALHQAQTQRAQAQKMEALGQLTGGVAHDFNNLLMIISGHIHTLARLAGGDAKAARAVEAITLAARRGQTLTRQLLTFSRRQTLNPEVADIAQCIGAVRTMLASTGGQTARLVTNLPPDLWLVNVDISEFELALINLTLNARDAMPQGGSITIGADNVRFAAGEGPHGITGDFVAITVADTGTGIAADILPQVFDPFFTTKQKSKGTGLGLSQVHGFAHQAGGTVTIASELGQGTRVTVYLPRASETARTGERSESGQAPGGSVLLVEDNPDVAEATSGMLEQLGYAVTCVDGAEAALAVIGQRGFDLVVSDVVMAGPMDGLGLARTLRQRNPELPVILVTGYSEAAGHAAKEFTLLRKPYQLAELSRAVALVTLRSAGGTPGNLIDLRDVRQGGGPVRPKE